VAGRKIQSLGDMLTRLLQQLLDDEDAALGAGQSLVYYFVVLCIPK
jgi:hypothetical protein